MITVINKESQSKVLSKNISDLSTVLIRLTPAQIEEISKEFLKLKISLGIEIPDLFKQVLVEEFATRGYSFEQIIQTIQKVRTKKLYGNNINLNFFFEEIPDNYDVKTIAKNLVKNNFEVLNNISKRLYGIEFVNLSDEQKQKFDELILKLQRDELMIYENEEIIKKLTEQFNKMDKIRKDIDTAISEITDKVKKEIYKYDYSIDNAVKKILTS